MDDSPDGPFRGVVLVPAAPEPAPEVLASSIERAAIILVAMFAAMVLIGSFVLSRTTMVCTRVEAGAAPVCRVDIWRPVGSSRETSASARVMEATLNDEGTRMYLAIQTSGGTHWYHPEDHPRFMPRLEAFYADPDARGFAYRLEWGWLWWLTFAGSGIGFLALTLFAVPSGHRLELDRDELRRVRLYLGRGPSLRRIALRDLAELTDEDTDGVAQRLVARLRDGGRVELFVGDGAVVSAMLKRLRPLVAAAT